MKPLTVVVIAFLVSVSAKAETRFTAYMVTKDQPLFVLNVDGSASGWIPLAGEFHGCHISAFDPKSEILTVQWEGNPERLPLNEGKVSAAPIDPNEALRTLKGLPLAYEVARRGDEITRLILIRYQQALANNNGTKAHENALRFLESQLERLAVIGAEHLLAQQPNKLPAGKSPSVTPPATQEPRH